MKRLLAVLSVLLTGLGVSLSVVLSQGGSNVYTVTLGGPHDTPEVAVEVPKAVAEQAADGTDSHAELRSENPADASASALDAAREQQERLAATDQLPIVAPDAAPLQAGCTTQLVRNYSSRRGVRPRLFVLHYTVSPNRPGWSDVYAIARLFDTASFQASSNYIVDAEGHCLYIVRESDKAWTQAAANPVSISVEVINSGREATYAGSAGLAKVGLIVRDATKRWGIPLQLGAVSGCSVVRAGVVDHGALGACGGGHHDISPFKVAPVLAAAKALVPRPKPKPKPRPAPVPCTAVVLQTMLGVEPDGIIGPRTRAAIRAFQSRHGLKPTGYAGARVGALLGLTGCAL